MESCCSDEDNFYFALKMYTRVKSWKNGEVLFSTAKTKRKKIRYKKKEIRKRK